MTDDIVDRLRSDLAYGAGLAEGYRRDIADSQRAEAADEIAKLRMESDAYKRIAAVCQLEGCRYPAVELEAQDAWRLVADLRKEVKRLTILLHPLAEVNND